MAMFDGPRGPEDPEPRELPLIEERDRDALIKTLAEMQFNQMKYGNPAGDRSGNQQGMPGGMSAEWLSKVGKWFAKLFGFGGNSGSLTAEQLSIRQAVDATAKAALGQGGGTTLGAIEGAIGTYGPLIKTGAAIADAYTQNKANNKDRALVGANMQASEVATAERARQDRVRLELDQKQAERTAQSDAYAKALQGALARYGQDVSIERPEGVANISFANSPRPSSIGETGRANGAALEALATRQLLNPEARTTLPPLERVKIPGAEGTVVQERAMLQPPPLTPEEEALLRARTGRGRSV